MRQDMQSLGDRLKKIEQQNTHYVNAEFPLYARLDGKKFSGFTRGMQRPFDDVFNEMMTQTVKTLVEETNASLAFHQSDEISLFWHDDVATDFGARRDKLLGELVGLATARFVQLTHEFFPNLVNRLPRFDCRLMNVSEATAADFFMWRQMDCIKNSVSQMSSAYIAHSELLGVSTGKRKQMLEELLGKPWDELPAHYRLGTFIRRIQEHRTIDVAHIPEEHRWRVPESAIRNVTSKLVYSPIQQFDDPRDILYTDMANEYLLEKSDV